MRAARTAPKSDAQAAERLAWPAVLLLVLAVVVSPSCRQEPVREDARLLARAGAGDADDTFDVAQVSDTLHLAVQVEVTAGGVRETGATIVRGPSKSGSAMADLIVRAKAGEEVIAEYVTPDPRLVEIEGETWRTLDAAETILFAPLVPGLTEIEVVPVEGREATVSRGGTVDARPLLRRACEDQPQLEPCLQVMGVETGVRVMLGGKAVDSPGVQQAILGSVPWAEIVGGVLTDDGPVPAQLLSGTTIYKDVRRAPFEPDLTWDRLAESGIDTSGLWIDLIYPRGNDEMARVAKLVASSLAQVDIPVELAAVDADRILDAVAELQAAGRIVMALSAS